ncbi:uncharacterized protein LOC112095322 [Morus notabilis]|uniref:uncharacterized protein LOC112095322 n=1 Tax=Morus notabilis TaxID=981085 RepID=UPI000CED42B7|nr:uncharacterized protein LOC112095322 [Morus notabilis]
MAQHEEVQQRTLQDYLYPTRMATLSCIMFPPNAPPTDFKPGMIALLPTFHGLENENPYVHIREFEEVVATFHSRAEATNTVKLNFFPFSLKDKAKSWLYSLRPKSIGTWEEMTTTFFNNWRLVSYFYDGLTIRERQFVEMMCNGDFLQNDPDEAIEYLNELAEKAHTWIGPSATESTSRSRPVGVYQLREEDSFKAQVEAFTKQIEALKSKDSKGPHMVVRTEAQEPYFVCGGMGHLAQDCLTFGEMRGVYEEQCNVLGTYNKPYGPFSNIYNDSWKHHPNFSWRDPNQHAQSSGGQWKSEQQSQPLRTYFVPQNNMQPKGNSLDDTLKAFMDAQNKTNQRVDSMLTMLLVEENKEIKSQITKLTGALTVQGRSKFPSQAQSNMRGQHMAQTSNSEGQNIKEVNAISTRSCKNFYTPSTSTTTSSNEESAQEKEEPTKILVKVPFPQALRPLGKVPENQSEILENLTQLKINLPLLHVIKQVPAYAKVIKDLCTIKRKYHVKKTAFLTEQVNAVIEQKTPPKYKDLGCPIISCQIGTQEFGQALLDLGSSVNLMPYSVYLQLGLGEIKPTSVVLQLADRSIKRPRGIVEDILVQDDKFYYPVDFLVLDTQSVVNMESSIPIILGRHFLATANALINCKNGLIKISFGNMTLEVNIFHIQKQPREDDECQQTFMIDTLVENEVQLQSNYEDLQNLFQNSDSKDSSSAELAHLSTIFSNSQDRGTKFGPPYFEELRTEGEKLKSSTDEGPKIKLVHLPEGLKHAFLGDEGTFPVIISSKLDALQEQRLIDMLKERNSRIKVKMKAAHDKQILRKNYLGVNQVEEIILNDPVYQP